MGERGGVSILKCVCMQLTHTCKRQLANMYMCAEISSAKLTLVDACVEQ